MEKKEKWCRRRHAVITRLAGFVLKPYTRWKYGISIRKFTGHQGRAYLVLYNHQTVFDQFFVGFAFPGAVYYMATEDIFSLGWISSLLRWAVAPIPIKKSAMDVQAVKNCIRIAKEGGTICIAPEGNRTYSGKTEYMNPAIASLAKKLGLPIALFRIEGGYGVQPRWSDVLRKGKMTAGVTRVIEPEEYENLSKEELYERIRDGLYVNEASADHEFHHPKRAEYLERVVYVCPYCGFSKFESHDDVVECMTCHRQLTYGPTTELKGVGFDFPFRFVNDWYEYQQNFVRALEPNAHTQTPLFEDVAQLSEVILQKRKQLLRKEAKIRLYGDRIVIDEDLILPFAEIAVAAALGRNKLNVYHGKMVYQFKGSKRFNALKYVNFIYHYKNTEKGDENGGFLGL